MSYLIGNTIPMNDERRLIHLCQKKNAQAQEQLYELYAKKMYAISLRYTSSQQEAEDVLQEAFIKVFDKILQFNGNSLGGWIKKIVVNTALNSQRSKLYMFPMADVEDLHTMGDDKFSLSGLELDGLLSMIRTLPQGCQVIFNLYAIEGYTHKEIAEQLNITEGTSKSQYHRAKELLKNMINTENRRSYERTW